MKLVRPELVEGASGELGTEYTKALQTPATKPYLVILSKNNLRNQRNQRLIKSVIICLPQHVVSWGAICGPFSLTFVPNMV